MVFDNLFCVVKKTWIKKIKWIELKKKKLIYVCVCVCVCVCVWVRLLPPLMAHLKRKEKGWRKRKGRKKGKWGNKGLSIDCGHGATVHFWPTVLMTKCTPFRVKFWGNTLLNMKNIRMVLDFVFKDWIVKSVVGRLNLKTFI